MENVLFHSSVMEEENVTTYEQWWSKSASMKRAFLLRVA